MVELLVALCVLCISSILFIYTAYRKKLNYLNGIPSPPSRFLVGHGLEIKSGVEAYQKLYEWSKEYGDVFYLKVGPIVQYVVSNADLLEHVTTSNDFITKADFYRFGIPWFGTGLLNATGEKWRKRRKIITPTFHFKILEQFVEIFNRNDDILVEKLKKIAGKPPIDICKYISNCNIDNICETAMGVSLNAQQDASLEYVESIDFLLWNLFDRNNIIYKYFDFTYVFTSSYRKEQKCLKIVHDFTESIIKKRKLELFEKADVAEEGDGMGIKRKTPFLDMLLKTEVDGKPLTDEDVREEVDTFMFEGHDTTSSSASFMLYCMSLYPKIQQRVYEEIYNILGGDKNKAISHSDCQEMKYFDIVMKECMRIYPPVPLIGRKVTKEFEFEGRKLLKGSTFLIFIHGLHMNPKYFKDPETFNPDRWLDDDNKHVFSYLPFSAGPRNCIGQKFAIIALKVIIAKVLMNFEVVAPEIPQELRISSQGVLKSENGIYLSFKPR